MAAQLSMPEILARLAFSGILSLDEYLPRGAHCYDQIAGDALNCRLLYVEPVPEFYGGGSRRPFSTASIPGA